MISNHLRGEVLIILLLLIGAMLMAGCGTVSAVGEIVDDDPNPLPTVRPGEGIGSNVESAAGDTPEETWERYLRDSIASQNDRQAIRLELIQSYQNPEQIQANAGGTLVSVDLLEDRTVFNVTNQDTFAQAIVDYDIRLTFVDGDTDTRTCSYQVQIERDPDDERWYVINPTGLDVYTLCG